MSSSYSNSLRIELIGSGDQAGTWGTTTDNNFAYIFDSAIAGYISVDITTSPHTLTSVNGPTSSSALNQSVYASLRFYNAVGASTVYAPAVSKTYIVWNDTSYDVTLYNTGYSTGPTIPAGAKILVFSTGTAFYEVIPSTITGTLAINKGGTGQTTANAAFNALAPSQGSANGKYLKSNGTDASWDAIDISTGDITGTLPIANGGTGTTSTTFVNLTTNVTGTLPIANGGTGTTSTTFVNLTTNVTGTLPVANGGTGVTSSTGSGNNVLSTSPTLTSPTFVTPVLGTPQSGNLANCTFPTLNQNTTGSAASAASLVTTNFSIVESGGKLYFKYGATNIASLDSSGNFTTLADVASYGTP